MSQCQIWVKPRNIDSVLLRPPVGLLQWYIRHKRDEIAAFHVMAAMAALLLWAVVVSSAAGKPWFMISDIFHCCWMVECFCKKWFKLNTGNNSQMYRLPHCTTALTQFSQHRLHRGLRRDYCPPLFDQFLQRFGMIFLDNIFPWKCVPVDDHLKWV